MKILQLSPQFPFPEFNGGRIGLASTFKQLSKNADVTFFCFSDIEIENVNLDEAQKFGKVIVYNHSTKNTIKRMLFSIFERTPLYISKHYSDEVFQFICELIVKEKFDIIHCDHTGMALLGSKLSKKFNIPCGLRLHNVEYLIWERYHTHLPFYKPQKWFVRLQCKRLKSTESELLNIMSINFPITEDDAAKAREISPNAKLTVAGPGINLENWNPEPTEKIPHQLIHATTYEWRHNVDAIMWFIKEVLPIIKKIIPDIKLILLGKNPPEKFNEYKILGVDVRGFVPEVKPFFNSSGIFISPLFVGGGIRIKILEAMAMQLPVVATSIAAEGIKTNRKNGLFLADSPEAFAKEIINLVQNPKLIVESGINARKYILDNYTWEKSIGIIYKSYEKLVQKA